MSNDKQKKYMSSNPVKGDRPVCLLDDGEGCMNCYAYRTPCMNCVDDNKRSFTVMSWDSYRNNTSLHLHKNMTYENFAKLYPEKRSPGDTPESDEQDDETYECIGPYSDDCRRCFGLCCN